MKINYGTDSITKNVSMTVRQLKQDSAIRACLGFSDNVRVLVGGIEQPDTAYIPENAVVTVETKANSKAGTVTIKYGTDSVTKNLPDNTTVAHIKGNSSIKAALGFSDNVRVMVNNIEQADNCILPYNAVITIETRANSKAAVKVTVVGPNATVTMGVEDGATVDSLIENESLTELIGVNVFGNEITAKALCSIDGEATLTDGLTLHLTEAAE